MAAFPSYYALPVQLLSQVHVGALGSPKTFKKLRVLGTFGLLGPRRSLHFAPVEPQAFKRPPRGAQEAPKGPPRGPKRPQKAPKRRPRGPQKGPQEAPEGPEMHEKT